MSRWFRFYADAVRNPKVAVLSDADFRLWTELLCLAADNDGLIPPLEAVKSLLKRRLDHLKAGIERLVKGGLIDPLEQGFEPHNWRKFQYKSDTSTDRVKRFRNVARNVSETPPDTETETEAETEKDTPLPPKGEKGFAYSGKVVRLNSQDYTDWRQRFHAIADFDAELSALDGWLADQPEAKQAKWFGSAAPWLNKRHQEALAREKPRAEPAFSGPC